MRVGFIGGGNMASAIVGGLVAHGSAAAGFHIVEIDAARRAELGARLGVTTAPAIDAAIAACEVVVMATKPQQMREAAALRPHLDRQLVVTIAAGIVLKDLARWLGDYANLVRVMPNTPALIHAGITGMYALPSVDAAGRAAAEQLLGAVGAVVWFDREELLDAVTAVSGSGPAYVFYFIEALQRAGERLGMTADQARRLAQGTFLGASRLAAESTDDVATLRARVTSKGGTTERAVGALQAAHVDALFIAAVESAAQRSRELGEEFGRG